MTQEDIEVLLKGNDFLINAISNSIGQNNNPEDKAVGRKMLKNAIEVGEKILKIKVEDKK